MKSRIIFYLKYYLFWIVVFVFFKILFILYQFNKFDSATFIDYLKILMYGLKMDISLASYIMIIPTMVFAMLSSFKNSLEYKIIITYTIIVLFFINLLHIIDLELYNYWRFRLDEEFLSYLNKPAEMLANLSWYHYIFLAILMVGLHFLTLNICFRRILKLDTDYLNSHSWINAPVFLLIAGALIIPIRGGLATAPLNSGTAYFHKEEIVNHATINPVWNLIYSYTEKDKLSFKIDFFTEEKEQELLQNLYNDSSDSTYHVLNTNRPNIILIILESFSNYLIKEESASTGVTPNLSKTLSEGLYFNHFYANGGNSKSGLGAILSGYPALPTTCILHYEKKSQTLPGINKELKQLDYHSKFLYGGDIDFAHFKSFLINNKFDRIISDKDFPKSDYLGKWGVPDHILFQRLLDECKQSSQPFFNVLFTLSSHEPYEIPMETVIEGTSKKEKFLNSVHYTDQALGKFMDMAKKQDWWDETLIILVADHGSRVEDMPQYDSKRYHIPMIWTGGALKARSETITKYGSQVDISNTLLNQLGVKTDAFIFGKDLLNSNSESFAQYTIRNGMGFISDSSNTVFDLNSYKFIETGDEKDILAENRIKAYTQWLLRDFYNR